MKLVCKLLLVLLCLLSYTATAEIIDCVSNGKRVFTDDKSQCDSSIKIRDYGDKNNKKNTIKGKAPEMPANSERAPTDKIVNKISEIEGFKRLDIKQAKASEDFFQIKKDSNEYFISSKDRLIKLNASANDQKVLYDRELTSGLYLTDMTSLNQELYVVTKRSIGGPAAMNMGINKINKEGEIEFFSEEKPAEIYSDKQTLWLGGVNYSGWIDIQTKAIHKIKTGYIWGLVDTGDSVWFGAREKYNKNTGKKELVGGVYFSNKKTKNIQRLNPSLLSSTDIFGLHAENDNLWISYGAIGMGVSRYNIKTKKSELLSYSANGIRLGGYDFASNNDYIWMAAHSKLIRLDKVSLIAEEYQCTLAKDCNIRDMLHDGQKLWLVLGDQGIVTLY